MGKKSSTSNSQVQSPTLQPSSPTPRMDAPPPYDSVPGRRSSSISMHSTDRMNVSEIPGDQPAPQRQSAETERQRAADRAAKIERQKQEGGCLNFGDNVSGCMNIGGGYDTGRTDGCMNYGGGKQFSVTDGCMNYQSRSGCMNYKSSGGCMNYEVADGWEDNEGCMNWRRGGGCLLRG